MASLQLFLNNGIDYSLETLRTLTQNELNFISRKIQNIISILSMILTVCQEDNVDPPEGVESERTRLYNLSLLVDKCMATPPPEVTHVEPAPSDLHPEQSDFPELNDDRDVVFFHQRREITESSAPPVVFRFGREFEELLLGSKS